MTKALAGYTGTSSVITDATSVSELLLPKVREAIEQPSERNALADLKYQLFDPRVEAYFNEVHGAHPLEAERSAFAVVERLITYDTVLVEARALTSVGVSAEQFGEHQLYADALRAFTIDHSEYLALAKAMDRLNS